MSRSSRRQRVQAPKVFEACEAREGEHPLTVLYRAVTASKAGCATAPGWVKSLYSRVSQTRTPGPTAELQEACSGGRGHLRSRDRMRGRGGVLLHSRPCVSNGVSQLLPNLVRTTPQPITLVSRADNAATLCGQRRNPSHLCLVRALPQPSNALCGQRSNPITFFQHHVWRSARLHPVMRHIWRSHRPFHAIVVRSGRLQRMAVPAGCTSIAVGSAGLGLNIMPVAL